MSLTFIAQLLLILLSCRCLGGLAASWGQARVVGEMVAGVLLGPSVLGAVWPEGHRLIFPPESLPTLQAVGQWGVVLYMWIVGSRFELNHLRGTVQRALPIAAAGIILPFLLAGALTPWLHGMSGMFAPLATPGQAWLFLGTAMSVTAFPMLARLIHEQGLSGAPLGMLALSAGAIDDAAAWCLLAAALADFGHAQGGAPWLLFGAFALGAATGRLRGVARLRQAIEPLVVIVLLPVFFTSTGLHVGLDVLVGGDGLLPALAILLASCLGKGCACWAAARAMGENHRDALALGALMNARGLMELMLIHAGHSAGMIGDRLFAILVVMAILTTVMAVPLFRRAASPAGRVSGSAARGSR